jgi:hypothetical protein
MQRKWLYFLVFTCCLAGGVWVAWNEFTYTATDPQTGMNLCLFKAATGLPCPSCGSTRSVLDITRMHFRDALYANPAGFIVGLAIMVLPFWILYDLATRRRTFYNFYFAAELVIRKRWVTICMILLIAANWAWNIYKYTS